MGKFQPKGGIYELRFGFYSKMGLFTTLMSDISKLSVITITFELSDLFYSICLKMKGD